MSAVPSLMFLYSNDATEIRYSDGSHLELSPCGSTMVYRHGGWPLRLRGKLIYIAVAAVCCVMSNMK